MTFVKAVRYQMVPACAEWWSETDNRATTPFGYCSSTAPLPVWPHCANARWKTKQIPRRSCQLPSWRTGGDHRDVSWAEIQ